MADPYLSMLAALAATLLGANGVMACDGLTDGPTGTVAAVLDGNSVKLDSGIVVKLIGTRAPDFSRSCGYGSAASCGGWPFSMKVFIRKRSASISLFGSEPKSLASA